eukprot:7800804-Prorocentrum_lima.AAC.1
MTSSLVGSEMCIRDRRGAEQGCNIRHDDMAEVGCNRGGRGHHLDAFFAVSYTHLTLPTICSV